MDKYTEAKTGSEITNILTASRESEENIIWQNIDDSRSVFRVLGLEFDKKAISIEVEKTPTFYPRIDHPIYCKLTHRESVFKSEILKLGEFVLQVKFPESVKAMEQRQGQRLKFTQRDQKQIKIVVGSHKTARTSLKAQAIDVSITGSGMQIELDQAALELVDKEVLITALETKVLTEPINCKVMYKRNYKCVINNELAERARIGLCLDRPLTGDELKEFIRP